MSKINDIGRWRNEIELAENFRNQEFGVYAEHERTKAGQNIQYYERGFSDNLALTADDALTTINVIDALTSVIVPSLYFKNPKTLAMPTRPEAEDTAPLAGLIIDHFRKKIDAQETNKKNIWDAYVLGYGVYKVGYATKFGKDIEDKEARKKKSKNAIDRGLEAVGLKKKKEEDTSYPDQDIRIVSESPFLEYISPFKFGIDPRANNLNDASYWYHKVRKTVKSLKENKKYKNTSQLRGTRPDTPSLQLSKVTGAELEAFETVDLYEIHYRNDDKFYILVISCDNGGEYREHLHEESIYSLGEWQVDMLSFKKHGHALYPRSDITKIKNLQDRITITVDSILEQVDKFTPKLAYDENAITKDGKQNLKFGEIGALIACNKSPDGVFKELNFTQLKADLAQLMEQLITLITIQTGLTRAQLTGMSESSTATEASIEQGGQTLRLSDMSNETRRFVNKQAGKLWKIVKQFVDLQELTLINGAKGIDEKTGLPKYNWLTLSPEQAEKMTQSEYDFDIEVGSTQNMDLSVVRKSFENWVNILARTEVIALLQQQGKVFDLGEFIKKGFELFPELGIDAGKIIRNVSNQTKGLIPPQTVENILGGGKGGQTQGSKTNELRAQKAERAPTQSQQIGEAR